MAVIPEDIYQTVEAKLRSREKMTNEAGRRMARAREYATNTAAPPISSSGGKTNRKKSRVEIGAVRAVEAEKELKDMLAWLEVFRCVDEIYPGVSDEGKVARMMYAEGLSQEDVCKITGCSRMTIRRRRDRYVIRTALLAAGKGLISEEVIKDGNIDPEE